jgi:hypothetical protein
VEQQPIKGYRSLSPQEVEIINQVKQTGESMKVIMSAVEDYLREQRIGAPTNEESVRITQAEPLRWCAIAKTHFQQGLMALTRAIAQPGSF